MTGKQPYRKMTHRKLELMSRGRAIGMTWQQIAPLVGYPHAAWKSLAQRASRYGLTRPKVPCPARRVRDLADQGLSRVEIARQLGCSRGAVDHCCKRHGIRTRGL